MTGLQDQFRRFVLTSAALALVAVAADQVRADQMFSYSTIADPSASDGTYAKGINNSGQIVGFSDDVSGNHGFLMTGSSFTPINVPVAISIQICGINNSGQIVGSFNNAYGYPDGFLMTGSSFTPINVPGVSQTYVTGINDSGQIVGYSYDNDWNFEGSFLATPLAAIPEPSTVAILATGLPLGLGFWCWKRRRAA